MQLLYLDTYKHQIATDASHYINYYLYYHNQEMMKRRLLYSVLLGAALWSCSTPKDITYLQGFDNGMSQQVQVPVRLTVQPDDKLSIVVTSRDPELAEIFNLPISNYRIGMSAANTAGYTSSDSRTATFTVDPDGNIDYPVLGKMQISGLSRAQVAEKIKQAIISSGLLKDPVVIVDFMNATVAVLGDVAHPGQYPIDRDEMTIFQALGKAGDLNITGMRENVLVVRREDGKEVAHRINLTDVADVMNSPVFYIRQNDVIYVEPNTTMKREANANGNTALTSSFWISVASVMTAIAVLVFK